jgi:diaminopropionate ammonia-lyase
MLGGMKERAVPASSRLTPDLATSLLDLPALARRAGVARVLVKCEGERLLGNFKSLGGRRAGRRALERMPKVRRLICASDGNHGLAVALAAQEAGAEARIFLPMAVPESRAARIRALGGEVVRVDDSYDVAVEMAAAAAARGDGVLIPDTTPNLDDPIVADVMAGYLTISDELSTQLRDRGADPSHVFVQAGVGGLAASLAEGLAERLAHPLPTVVVEPQACPCVGLALRAGRPVQIDGEIHSSAEMLACGLASAAAVRTLLAHSAQAVEVSEPELIAAPAVLREGGGPASTPSGAAGLAGLLHVADDPARRFALGLNEASVVLLIATEAANPDACAENACTMRAQDRWAASSGCFMVL